MHVCLLYNCKSGTQRGQKRDWIPKSGVTDSYELHMGSRNQTWILFKSS